MTYWKVIFVGSCAIPTKTPAHPTDHGLRLGEGFREEQAGIARAGTTECDQKQQGTG